MFSSNQKLEVSGEYDQLKSALEFALKLEGTDFDDLCYQTTEDGKFCIGWMSGNGLALGWKRFQFDFDLEIVSRIIVQFLSKQKRDKFSGFDGSTVGGFIMKAIPETFSDTLDGIKNPFYGIVSFKAFTCFYSK